MANVGYGDAGGYGRPPQDRGWFGDLDWGAILASVIAGLGITILLVTLGAAAGIEAGDDGGDEGTISRAVGTWTVISALLGTLIGTFIGGRFSRWDSPGSAVYHAITSWGLAQVLGALLGAIGALGLLGAALRRTDPAEAEAAAGGGGEEAADAISWGGWALALGMLLTLAAAIIGWWLGSRTRISDAERDYGGGGRGYRGQAGMGAGGGMTTTGTGMGPGTPAGTGAGVGTTGTAGTVEEDRPTTWTGT